MRVYGGCFAFSLSVPTNSPFLKKLIMMVIISISKSIEPTYILTVSTYTQTSFFNPLFQYFTCHFSCFHYFKAYRGGVGVVVSIVQTSYRLVAFPTDFIILYLTKQKLSIYIEKWSLLLELEVLLDPMNAVKSLRKVLIVYSLIVNLGRLPQLLRPLYWALYGYGVLSIKMKVSVYRYYV